jgi:homoaconitase/3-isopropylmalate dehydratase large subunit
MRRNISVKGALMKTIAAIVIAMISVTAAASESEIFAEIEKETKKKFSPADRLGIIYSMFMEAQACYNARKDTTPQYITRQEFDTARAITRRIEQQLLRSTPSLKKDAVWEAEVAQFQKSDLKEMLNFRGQVFHPTILNHCRGNVQVYSLDKQQQKQEVKKDF